MKLWSQARADEGHSRGSALRKSPSCRKYEALRESRGYWIKTFGLASVIREDSPGAEWELDQVSDNNKKQSKLRIFLKVWARKIEIKKVSHIALFNIQQLDISCKQIFKQVAHFVF